MKQIEDWKKEISKDVDHYYRMYRGKGMEVSTLEILLTDLEGDVIDKVSLLLKKAIDRAFYSTLGLDYSKKGYEYYLNELYKEFSLEFNITNKEEEK